MSERVAAGRTLDPSAGAQAIDMTGGDEGSVMNTVPEAQALAA
jgi:hypothetical protein